MKGDCYEEIVSFRGGGNLKNSPSLKSFSDICIAGKVSRLAFTLAEVLITLGVIAVVCALTIPSLVANHREKTTVTRVKQAYRVLSEAYELAVIKDDRTPKFWGMSEMYDVNSHIAFANRLKPYLKLSKDCVGMSYSDVRKNCYADYIIAIPSHYANVVLNNGTVVSFRTWFKGCNKNYGNIKNACGQISVDVNGNKKPNLGGEDRFLFYFTDDKGLFLWEQKTII